MYLFSSPCQFFPGLSCGPEGVLFHALSTISNLRRYKIQRDFLKTRFSRSMLYRHIRLKDNSVSHCRHNAGIGKDLNLVFWDNSLYVWFVSIGQLQSLRTASSIKLKWRLYIYPRPSIYLLAHIMLLNPNWSLSLCSC